MSDAIARQTRALLIAVEEAEGAILRGYVSVAREIQAELAAGDGLSREMADYIGRMIDACQPTHKHRRFA